MQSVSAPTVSPLQRCCPNNGDPSGFKVVIFAPFSVVFFGEMGRGPFRWAVNYGVVTPVSC